MPGIPRIDKMIAPDELIGKRLAELLASADSSRHMIGRPGWTLPPVAFPNVEIIDGNLLTWDTIKPEVRFNGTGNVVMFGPAGKGGLKGAFRGNGNLCFFGGGADRAVLRVDMIGSGGLIYIGAKTKIVGGHILTAEAEQATSVMIGERSMLSTRVTLRASDSHGIVDLQSRTVINTPCSIVVEPHVWIGEGATLLKGARVGAGSIVGAGALVTSLIPHCSICGGIPAKVIRSDATWTERPNPSAAAILAVEAFLKTVGVAPVAESPAQIRPDKGLWNWVAGRLGRRETKA
jgi:carbonic anhydrase/acetyltransferase-like protein (isoleucine patch superfamily)